MNNTHNSTLLEEMKTKLLEDSLSERDFLLGLLDVIQQTDVNLGTHPYAYQVYELLQKDEDIRHIFENHHDLKDVWTELIRMSYENSSHVDKVRALPDRNETGPRVFAAGPENVAIDAAAVANKKQLFSYHITINAPIKVVFLAMTSQDTYQEWTKVWGTGMTFLGDWKQGAEITFVNQSKRGTKAVISSMINNLYPAPTETDAMPNIYARLNFISLLVNGDEIKELDEEMRQWLGTEINCELTELKTNETNVTVHILAHKSFTKKINTWDEALMNLKHLCENKF